jgi:hypothetical protein
MGARSYFSLNRILPISHHGLPLACAVCAAFARISHPIHRHQHGSHTLQYSTKLAHFLLFHGAKVVNAPLACTKTHTIKA